MPDRTCSADGCGNPLGPKGAKGLCPKHYQAHRLAGAAPPCCVVGCDKPSHSRQMCPMHYQRWRVHGEAGQADRTRHPNDGPCSVEGCEQPMRKRTWCAAHYAQWCNRGQVEPFQYKWGDGGYVSTHKRISRARGRASEHRCTDCSRAAHHWSYDYSDPDPLFDERGLPYSRDMTRYQPRCGSCHRLFDNAHAG